MARNMTREMPTAKSRNEPEPARAEGLSRDAEATG